MSSSSSPKSCPAGEKEKCDGAMRGREIHILFSKRSVSTDECACETLLTSILTEVGLGACVKHWALRVGGDVYELRQKDGVNHWYRKPWEEVKQDFDVGDYYGRTTASRKGIGNRARILINAGPGYDFVQVNCQTFALNLAASLPKTERPLANPKFDSQALKLLANDLQKYLSGSAKAASKTFQAELDKMIRRLKHAFFTAVGIALANYKSIVEGIKALLQSMPQDALTWVIEGITSAINAMTPVLKCIAGSATSAWNALATELGGEILIGVVVVGAVCGVAWLAYKGGERFVRWWKAYGRDLKLDEVILELQERGPEHVRLKGIVDGEVVVQRRCQPRHVRLQ